MEIPKYLTRADIVPESFDEKTRTFEVVFSRGAPVERWGRIGETYQRFNEELSLEPEHVRLERLRAGAPVLDNHFGWGSVNDQIGVVERAEVDGKEGKATIRFPKDMPEDSSEEKIFRKVRDGIIKNVSVGYRTHKMRDVTPEGEERRTLRAIDWEPMEISLVPIPADPGAQVRGEQQFFKVITEGEKPKMTIEQKTDRGENTPSPPETGDHSTLKNPDITKETMREEIEKARAAERTRIKKIRRSVEVAGIGNEFAETLIDSGTSADQASTRILEKLAEEGEKFRTASLNQPDKIEAKDVETKEQRMSAVEDAILHRYKPEYNWKEKKQGDFELSERARTFRALTLIEVFRKLTPGGETMNRSDLVDRAFHSSSDFPKILANVLNKSLRKGYEESPQTFHFMTEFVSASDFKDISNLQLGEAPQLELVDENGEYKSGTIVESREVYAMKEYGKKFGLSRKAMINDDRNAFTRIPDAFGKQTANLESDIVWAIITGNQVMEDTLGLFQTATHKNLAGAGAAISITTLSAARVDIRRQKGLDGLTHLNLLPMWLVVPVSQQSLAEQFLSDLVIPEAAGGVNPFRSSKSGIQLIVEPRLDDASLVSWYLFADRGQIDMIQAATLDGKRGPTLATRDGFDVAGMEWRVNYDFGARALDYRGFYKNPGA